MLSNFVGETIFDNFFSRTHNFKLLTVCDMGASCYHVIDFQLARKSRLPVSKPVEVLSPPLQGYNS